MDSIGSKNGAGEDPFSQQPSIIDPKVTVDCPHLNVEEKQQLTTILGAYEPAVKEKIILCFSYQRFQEQVIKLQGQILECIEKINPSSDFKEKAELVQRMRNFSAHLQTAIDHADSPLDLHSINQQLSELRALLKTSMITPMTIQERCSPWEEVELSLLRLHLPPKWVSITDLASLTKQLSDELRGLVREIDLPTLATHLNIHERTRIDDLRLEAHHPFSTIDTFCKAYSASVNTDHRSPYRIFFHTAIVAEETLLPYINLAKPILRKTAITHMLSDN